MNLILLFPEDKTAVNEVTLTDHRATHIYEILKGKPEQQIKVGLLNKGEGLATVLSCDKKKTVLKLGLISAPKPSLFSNITLLIALPRPQTLKKVLETAATFGVGEMIFIKSERVEKSFFQSTLLKDNAYLEHVYLGLQQGGYVIPPKISFFQDQKYWETIPKTSQKWIAHLGNFKTLKATPLQHTSPVVIAIGPEGGWLDPEMEHFRQKGFHPFILGKTIHRVENAVCAVLSQLELLGTLS